MQRLLGLLCLLAVVFSDANAQVEHVSNLDHNPVLYRQTEAYRLKRAEKGNTFQDFIFSSNPVTLPFIDDFSKNYLATYSPEDFVVDTINRSLAEDLSGNQVTLELVNSSILYTVTVTGNDTIITQTPVVGPPTDSIVLYDNPFDPLIPTDTIRGYLPYNIITVDTTVQPHRLDTVLATADTTIIYSVLRVVIDPNALWLDNYVCLNNQLATNPLSYNVATFDGLDQFGEPYARSLQFGQQFGGADTLTSVRIDLSGFSVNDSLVLSFALQGQGLGDFPNTPDEFVLEFKEGVSWQTPNDFDPLAGYTAPLTDPTFLRYNVKLDKAIYFDPNFQFRFRNFATLTGNNDHWHLDYVMLDEDRSSTDLEIKDVSIVVGLESILENYTSMPWRQFSGYPTEQQDSIIACWRNNNTNSGDGTFEYIVREEYSNTTLFTFPELDFFSNLTGDDYFCLNENSSEQPVAPFLAPFAGPTDERDSVLITTTLQSYDYTPTGSNSFPDNDTVTTSTLFDNYFAYDDGSAEKAYGIGGTGGLKRFAYEFHLNEPDTLQAILIHFTQVTGFSGNELFTLFVWDSLDLDNTGAAEDTIFEARFQRPVYNTTTKNGFFPYPINASQEYVGIDSNIVLPAGTFYVGWAQTSEENIQVGLDLNNSARSHMFFEANGVWRGSSVEGAPMIRPVFDSKEPSFPVATADKEPEDFVQANNILVYPNPVQNKLFFSTDIIASDYEAQIFDIQGREVLRKQLDSNSIDVQNLHQGVYILKLHSDQGRLLKPTRFIKID